MHGTEAILTDVPATFPSHPGAVLPLKLWRPLWFDGVALAVGAASPDVAYLADGSGLPVWPFSHQWLGLLGWCLPVTVTLSWLIRRAAPIVAAHLPQAGVFALRDYGALGLVRHRWWVTASSAVIGGASHVAFDLVNMWGTIGEWAGHLTGAAACLWVLVHIGQRRMIAAWHGPAPAVQTRPALFWSAAGAVFLGGVVLVPMLPAALLRHTTGVRLIAAAALALLAGGLLTSRARPQVSAGTTRYDRWAAEVRRTTDNDHELLKA